MKQENGFALVSVLIITTITTMLAFSQMKENNLQERIGGNQQKELNARLAAEKGIIDTFERIKAENANGTSNSTIKAILESAPYTNTNTEGYTLQNIELDDSTFSFESKGTYYGAEAYLKTKIDNIEATGVFDDAVLACKGITVGGSTKIDSYTGGTYDDSATPSTNASVKVIDGGVTLGNGGGSGTNKGIFGSVTAYSITGNTDLIKGDSVTGYVGEASDCDPLEIADNMPTYSGTPASFTAGAVSNFDGTSTVDGFTPEDLEVLGETKKVYIFDDFTSESNGNIINIEGDVTFFITGDMDTKNTTFELAADSSLTIFIDGKMQVDTNSGLFVGESVSTNNGKVPLTVYSSFGATSTATTTPTETTTPAETITETTETKGSSAVTTYTKVTTTDTTITTYTMTTTVKTTGKKVETTTDENEVVVLIEATIDTEDTTELAVTLSGNAQIYMNLYAPHGNVAYNGGGGIMGALRAKNVDISGNGGIHYDEGLSGMGGSGTDASTSYSVVSYYYPNE